jgi:glycosyltransferase involved in cell wall biosynthesis
VNVPEIRLLELRNTYKWGGGPDKTILLSAERHDPSRVNVVVAYIRDVRDCEFEIAKKARAKGLTFYEIIERGKFDPSVLRTIRDIVIRHDINLIHSHDYKSDLFAYLVRKWLWRRRIALISTAHAWVILGPRGEFYRKLDLRLMKRFDHLIAVSHATKAEMVDAGVPENIITVIHNGIDTEAWASARANGNIREELKLNPSTPVVGYVGRISPEKDLDTWLRAAALVADSIPTARFVLVGDGRDGNTQGRLERLAVSLEIGDRVIFAGYRQNLLPVYAAFDIFLLTSRREGLPNSILEAMAMRLPVVTTDVAGAKELVADGQTGFVLPQGQTEALAQALVDVMLDDHLRLRMARLGRQRVEQEFSFGHRLRRIEDLYGSVLNPRSTFLSQSQHAENQF